MGTRYFWTASPNYLTKALDFPSPLKGEIKMGSRAVTSATISFNYLITTNNPRHNAINIQRFHEFKTLDALA